MSEDAENLPPPSAEAGEAATGEKPVKKKTSVKVVRRVKSKKSEKGERPELAPPPPTIDEQSGAVAAPAEPEPAAPKPAAAPRSSISQEPSSRAPSSRTSANELTSSRPARTSSKKRTTRSGSNVFAMFTQNQIHQFKEAFSFIDSDKDGIISRADIRASFDALGRLCSDKELEEMTSEAPGPINFTMFLSVFGDRIQGTDEEDVVVQAFGRYDEGDGFCKEEKLRHALMTWGEKFTAAECDTILREAPTDSRGRIDIKRFANLVTRGQDEEDEES